jgi:hypothetical protein
MSDSFGLGPGPLSRPDPVEPPQRSGGARALLWVLVIVLIVAVALTGGAFAAGLIGGSDDPAAAPTGAPTGAATTRPSTGGTAASTSGNGATGQMTVALPQTLGGVAKVKDAKPSATGKSFPVTARAEGTFGDNAGRNIMYVLAVAGGETPQEQRAALFGTEVSDRFETGTLISVEPGPLGGSAACGTGKWNGRAAAVCVWDDQHTNGVLVDSPGNADALTAKLPALRAEVERPAA